MSFLLCTDRNHEFSQQLKMLQDFTVEATRDFKVGLLAEEFIGAFKEVYGISGTPTYLLLVQEQERGRLLGFGDLKALKNWLGEVIILS